MNRLSETHLKSEVLPPPPPTGLRRLIFLGRRAKFRGRARTHTGGEKRRVGFLYNSCVPLARSTKTNQKTRRLPPGPQKLFMRHVISRFFVWSVYHSVELWSRWIRMILFCFSCLIKGLHDKIRISQST